MQTFFSKYELYCYAITRIIVRRFWPIMNHGELAALYCFVFLYICFRGYGELGPGGLLGKRPANAG